MKPFILHIPTLRVAAAAFWPFIFIQKKALLKNRNLINHELIHLRQQTELLIVPFYILYGINFLINLITYRDSDKAYREIIFEREAFKNENRKNYLNKRAFWAFINYL